MPSVIQADLLKDASATKTLATLSSSAVTLHSDVTFPTGKLINSKFHRMNSGSGHTTTSSTLEAALNYVTFNCTSGNTIHFGYNFYAAAYRASGTVQQRYARFRLYQSTAGTRPAEGATSDLGTELYNAVYGRNLVAANTDTAASYASYNASATFEATANTHHLGLVFNSEAGGGDLVNNISIDSGTPCYFFAMEFQGDLLTVGAIP